MKSLALAIGLALVPADAMAQDNTTSITIKDHKFAPAEIHVKANAPTTVTLTNDDDQAEEFDSL